MSENTVRRFSWAEIAYHWSQAIPYLVLFCTGGALLLQRLLGVEVVPPAALSVVHRVTGLILIVVLTQTLVVSLFTGEIRELARTVRESLSWGMADAIWLAKMPFHVAWPAISLPPMGRMNPGQKLHVLFVATLVPGFIVTGVWMMLARGALAAWAIHAALFAPACGFMLVHLFLSLVNPPTRQALPGVLGGSVAVEYARAHHPLWVGEGKGEEHSAIVSLRPLLATAAALAVVASIGVVVYGPRRLKERTALVLKRNGVDAILPGGLCVSHAKDPKAQACRACHRLFGPLPSSACLECHKPIQQVMAAKLGYHGTLAGECRDCHTDHAGESFDIRGLDAKGFNHNRTRYPLDGKHKQVDCEKCHSAPDAKQTRHIGLRFDACTDCHPNVHEDARAANCARCHTLRQWKQPDLLFAHNRDSDFHLQGKHAEIACEKCHPPVATAQGGKALRLYGLGRQCAECHPDPHGKQFKKTCEACHSEVSWKGRWVVDAHGQGAEFPLLGKHRTAECVKCHRLPNGGAKLAEALFANTPKTCEGCHPDPHRGQMRSKCAVCHTDEGWKGRHLLFAHDQHSEFAIDGIHADLACLSCHKGEQSPLYRPLPRTCEGCHSDVEKWIRGVASTATDKPDPHAGRVACIKCHLPSVRHQSPAQHADTCRACHNEQYIGLFYEWQKTFREREVQVEKKLKALREANDPGAGELEKKIGEARGMGFHNIQLARRLWDEILAAAPSASGPAGRERP